MLMAATLSVAACKKQKTAPSSTTMAPEPRDSRAMIAGGQFKKSSNGLELDYDLEIKETSTNKYTTTLKINGVNLNGKKIKGFKSSAIFGIVLGLNTTKEDKAVPLSAALEETELSSVGSEKTITFKPFEYKGDLAYTLVNAKISISIGGGSVTINDDSRFTLFGEEMSVPNGGLKTSGGNVFGDNSTILISERKEAVETNFALLLDARGAIMEDEGSYFVLPSGHTLTQNPELAKLNVGEEADGTYGYVTVTISGDPARSITNIYYQACPADGSTKDSKDQPILKFEATHFNENNGVQRFTSTQTWTAVYGKTNPKLHFGCMQYWHGSTRVDVQPSGAIK